MVATPAAGRLAEFHPAGRASTGVQFRSEHVSPKESEPADVSSALEAAYQQGFRAGQNAAEEEFARLRAAAEAQQAAREIQSARQLGQDLAGQLAASIDQLGETITSKMAALIRPFLRRAIEDQAIDALIVAVRKIVPAEAEIAMSLTGPAALLTRIREAFEDRGVRLDCEEGPGPDIRVTIDQTTLETRIAAWLSALEVAQ